MSNFNDISNNAAGFSKSLMAMSDYVDGSMEKIIRKACIDKVNIIKNTSKCQMKACPKCGVEKPSSEFHKNKSNKDKLSTYCKKCNNKYREDHKKEKSIYLKQYRNDNKEKISIAKKVYRQTHKKEIAATLKRYYEENKESLSEKSKEYRDNHKEESALTDKRYRENNKEKIAAGKKKYQKENKEKIAAYERQRSIDNKAAIAEYKKKYYQTDRGIFLHRIAGHKRRALKMNAGYEIFDPKEVFEGDRYICQHCGKKTRPDYKNTNHPLYPNLDHIIPLSKGGPHIKANTQCLCRQCNMKKSNNAKGDQMRLF